MARIFSYGTASLFVTISAILHLISPVFAGFDENVMTLLPAGLLYLVFAWGLSRQMRWLAYIVFIVLLIGTLVAFGFSFNGTTVPAWLYGGISLANLVALIALFGVLWRNKPIIA